MRIHVEYWAFRIILASLRWTPLGLANLLAVAYVRLFDVLIPKFRRIANRNLQLALPSSDREPIVAEMFLSIARMLAVFARFPDIDCDNVSKWIRCEGFEHFVEAKRRGKGVLFATAHLGAWELSAFAHALMAEPMHIVIRPLDNVKIDADVARRRTQSGNTLIAKKDAARAVFQALRRNEAVGVLIDQNVTHDEGVFVNFFGTEACSGDAFVRIAHRSGATIIPGYALWSKEERRFILQFFPGIELSGDIQADTQVLHTHLEQVIREHPGQWLWLHRRWKTRPKGQPALY